MGFEVKPSSRKAKEEMAWDRVRLEEDIRETSFSIGLGMEKHKFQVQEYCGRFARITAQARHWCQLMTVMEHMGWVVVAGDAEFGCIFRKQS